MVWVVGLGLGLVGLGLVGLGVVGLGMTRVVGLVTWFTQFTEPDTYPLMLCLTLSLLDMR